MLKKQKKWKFKSLLSGKLTTKTAVYFNKQSGP